MPGPPSRRRRPAPPSPQRTDTPMYHRSVSGGACVGMYRSVHCSASPRGSTGRERTGRLPNDAGSRAARPGKRRGGTGWGELVPPGHRGIGGNPIRCRRKRVRQAPLYPTTGHPGQSVSRFQDVSADGVRRAPARPSQETRAGTGRTATGDLRRHRQDRRRTPAATPHHIRTDTRAAPCTTPVAGRTRPPGRAVVSVCTPDAPTRKDIDVHSDPGRPPGRRRTP
jgi:hypothetical protein